MKNTTKLNPDLYKENEIKQKLDEEFKKLKEKINKAHKILHDKYQASNWFEDKATKKEKSIITSLKSANTRSDIDITEEKYNRPNFRC